ncbi:hypothetical protein L211DRAFT_878043 [Terfezia boudieri ATCC MYA-4762]|uniref:Uncharacterized protein n=1 Tax=Terfezia boudieri ATCC MYA-4762 TaxID=1051890 RepID=A0A3N4M2G6_9PEZI|nr:hypothetical protein L211DRAFT_878043 [Terfezia boudieri ATCC MYA-4762]
MGTPGLSPQNRQLTPRPSGTLDNPPGALGAPICARDGSEVRNNRELSTATGVEMTFGESNDRLRHRVHRMEWDLTGHGEVKVELKGKKSKGKVSDGTDCVFSGDEADEEVKEKEDNEGICVYSGEPMDIKAAGSRATSPGDQKKDPASPCHKVSSPAGDSPEPVMPGRQRVQEEITKNQSSVNCFTQIIGKGVCLECGATDTSDGVLNPVQQGDQEMSLPYTPTACSCDVDNGDDRESAKNEGHIRPAMLIEIFSDDEDLDDLLPPVNTTTQRYEVVSTIRGERKRLTSASFSDYLEKGYQSSNFGEPQGPNNKRRSSPAFECSGELETSAVGSAASTPLKKKGKTAGKSHWRMKQPRNQRIEHLDDAQFSPPVGVEDGKAPSLSEMAELQHNYVMALEENHTLSQENAIYKYQIKVLQDQHFKLNHEKDTMEDTNKGLAERNLELEEQIEDAESALVAEMRKRRVSEEALIEETKKRKISEEALAAEIKRRKKSEEKVKEQEIKIEKFKRNGENRTEKTKEKIYATLKSQELRISRPRGQT